MFLALSGLIGAGKTTLATKIAEKLGLLVYYEPVEENEYITKFYDNMKEYGLILQFELLYRRFTQQQQIIWSGKGAVQDRSIYEDIVFVKMLTKAGLLNPDGAAVYQKIFDCLSKMMTHPTCIIHLDVSPEKALERIRKRGRGMESKITLEYMKDLHQAYQEFLQEISRTVPVIRINWNEFRDDIDAVTSRVVEEIKAINRVHTIPSFV